jgi:hypothetical protein
VTDPLADDDDQALRALGRQARARLAARPEAWEAVARGERGEDEVAVERLAAGDAPAAVALAREVFRPPDEAEHAALVDALLAHQAASREPVVVVTAPAQAAANDSGRSWLVGLLALAAVVALAWWLVPDRSGSPTDPDPPVIALAPLPAYLLETDGGLTAMRSQPVEPTDVLRYRAGMELEWRMRPQVAVQGDVGVRLFAFGEGTAKALATDGLVEVSPTGSVRVAGTIDALGLGRGAWTIAIVVGRPSALPSEPAEVRDAEGTDAWAVQRISLVIED